MKLILNKIPNHLYVTLTGWVAKFVTASAQLISIKLIINLLGVEQYATFSLLVAMLVWFTISDLGLGYSLQNFISENQAAKCPETFNQKITACTILLLISFILFSILSYYLSPLLGPVYLRSSNVLSEQEKTSFFFISSLLSIVSGIGVTSYKILFAWHKGYWSNLLPAVLSSLSLIFIYVLNYAPQNSNLLLWSVIIWLGPSCIFPFFLLIALTVRKFKKKPSKKHFFELLKRSWKFAFFSFLAVITLQADYVIMSQFLNNRDIVEYTLATKLFTLLFFVYTTILMSLWPIYAENMVRGEIKKIKDSMKKNIIFGFFIILIGASIVLLCKDWIVDIIVPGKNVYFSSSLVILLTCYYLIRVWTDTHAVIVNSVSKLKPLMMLVPIQAFFSVVLQIYFVKRYGLNGLVIGLIVSFLLTVSWGLPYYLKRNVLR